MRKIVLFTSLAAATAAFSACGPTPETPKTAASPTPAAASSPTPSPATSPSASPTGSPTNSSVNKPVQKIDNTNMKKDQAPPPAPSPK